MSLASLLPAVGEVDPVQVPLAMIVRALTGTDKQHFRRPPNPLIVNASHLPSSLTTLADLLLVAEEDAASLPLTLNVALAGTNERRFRRLPDPLEVFLREALAGTNEGQFCRLPDPLDVMQAQTETLLKMALVGMDERGFCLPPDGSGEGDWW